jgi:hypothetical protein
MLTLTMISEMNPLTSSTRATNGFCQHNITTFHPFHPLLSGTLVKFRRYGLDVSEYLDKTRRGIHQHGVWPRNGKKVPPPLPYPYLRRRAWPSTACVHWLSQITNSNMQVRRQCCRRIVATPISCDYSAELICTSSTTCWSICHPAAPVSR